MFEITKKSIVWGGRSLTIEIEKIARQVDGAVVVTYGETQVLATVKLKITLYLTIFSFNSSLYREILLCWKNSRRLFKKRR